MDNFFSNNDYFDRPLMESKNFKVVPSLGSIVPGWCLIVPKKFHLNYSNLPGDQIPEVKSLISKMKHLYSDFFGNEYVIFEHGPNKNQTSVGCGVDYAHLHFVPTRHNLIEGLQQIGYYFDWVELTGIEDLSVKVNSLSYLYLMDQDGKSFICSKENIPSQVFRRVIAQQERIPSQFNWREFPFHENIKTTINNVNLISY